MRGEIHSPPRGAVTIPFLGAIPYFYFYSFSNRWIGSSEPANNSLRELSKAASAIFRYKRISHNHWLPLSESIDTFHCEFLARSWREHCTTMKSSIQFQSTEKSKREFGQGMAAESIPIQRCLHPCAVKGV